MGLKNYLLELTGGSTKGAGTAGAAVQLINAAAPAAILCTSVGALIALPLALSVHAKYKYMQGLALEETRTVTMQKMFPKAAAFNARGKITLRAIWRALCGRNSLGVQDTRHYIKKHVTERIFKEYKQLTIYPPIYVSVTNYYTGALEYINLKHVDYTAAVEWIEASAHMPVFTQPICIDGTAYYDGGIIDKSGSDYAAPILIENNIKQVVSIYHHARTLPAASSKQPQNISQAAARYLQITQHQQALNDAKLMQALCERIGAVHMPLYIQNYMQSFYDTEPQRLQQMQIEAAAAAKEFIKQFAE